MKGGMILDCAGNRAAVPTEWLKERAVKRLELEDTRKGRKGELLGSPSPKRNGASRPTGAIYSEGGESRRCCRFHKSPGGDAPRDPREGRER